MGSLAMSEGGKPRGGRKGVGERKEEEGEEGEAEVGNEVRESTLKIKLIILVTIVEFLLHLLHTVTHVVEWSESNVSPYLGPLRNLVDGPLRTLDLSRLHCAGRSELIAFLIRVLEEGGEGEKNIAAIDTSLASSLHTCMSQRYDQYNFHLHTSSERREEARGIIT